MTHIDHSDRNLPDFLFQPGAYFLSGTDTDVGKTFVGCLLAKEATRRGLKVGAYKPVASGFSSQAGSDGERLWLATNRVGCFDQVSPQRFSAPLAPELAAAAEERTIDEALLLSGFAVMRAECELLIVEGAGGLFSPVSPSFCNSDLALHWDLPVVLVASWKLGMVHQVLCCLIAAKAKGIRIAAIILSENCSQDQLSLSVNRKFLSATLSRFYGKESPVVFGVYHNAEELN